MLGVSVPVDATNGDNPSGGRRGRATVAGHLLGPVRHRQPMPRDQRGYHMPHERDAGAHQSRIARGMRGRGHSRFHAGQSSSRNRRRICESRGAVCLLADNSHRTSGGRVSHARRIRTGPTRARSSVRCGCSLPVAASSPATHSVVGESRTADLFGIKEIPTIEEHGPGSAVTKRY